MKVCVCRLHFNDKHMSCEVGCILSWHDENWLIWLAILGRKRQVECLGVGGMYHGLSLTHEFCLPPSPTLLPLLLSFVLSTNIFLCVT